MMKQRVIAMMPRILAIVAVVVILGAALGAGSALAAKGGIKGKPDGNGNGGNGNGDSYAATLTATPNPAPPDSLFELTGCGFVVGKGVNIDFVGFGGTWVDGVDASGCIYPFTWVTPSTAGTYTINVHQQLKDHGKNQWVLMASTTLVVE